MRLTLGRTENEHTAKKTPLLFLSLTHTWIHNHTYTHICEQKVQIRRPLLCIIMRPYTGERNKSGSVVGPAVQWGIVILVSRFMSIGHLRSPGQQCMVHLGETSRCPPPPLKQTSKEEVRRFIGWGGWAFQQKS